jgi:hypothetical protein
MKVLAVGLEADRAGASIFEPRSASDDIVHARSGLTDDGQ